MSGPTSTRSARAVLPILLTALVALALAAGVLWYLTSTPAKPSLEEGRGVAEPFLAALREGAPDRAWEMTSAEFKSAEGREAFRKYVAAHPILKTPTEYVSTQTVDVQGRPRDEYLYRAPTYEDGKKSVRLLIGPDAGAWKVDHFVAD